MARKCVSLRGNECVNDDVSSDHALRELETTLFLQK